MKTREVLILITFLSLTLFITACTSGPDANLIPTVSPSPPTETPSPTAEPSLEYLVVEGEPELTYVAPFPVTISLDGDLSEWEGVPLVSMGNPDSTEIMFAAASDGDFIYFMANVIDRAIISGEHGDQYWNEDSVEFYLNATGDFSLSGYIDGVAQITIPPINIGKSFEEIIFSGINVDATGARAVVVETEQGYAVELSVPASNNFWDIPVIHNNALGFNVHLNGFFIIN